MQNEVLWDREEWTLFSLRFSIWYSIKRGIFVIFFLEPKACLGLILKIKQSKYFSSSETWLKEMLKCKGVGQHGLPRILCNLPVYSTLWQVDTKVFTKYLKFCFFSIPLVLIWNNSFTHLHVNSKLYLYGFLVVLDACVVILMFKTVSERVLALTLTD